MDRVVAVTGAGSGIGRAIAELLAEQGHRVAIGDLDEDGGRATADAIAARGGQAIASPLDVCDHVQLERWFDEITERWGGLDGLVNNAGINGPIAPLEEYPIEEFQRVIQVNLISVSLATRAVIPHLRRRGGGAIVNVGSTASLQGYGSLSGYTAAKHAVLGLTRSVAIEYAHVPIRVNCVCPGPVDTPLMRGIYEALNPAEPAVARELFAQTSALKRYADAREIASVVAFLLGDGATYVTGAAIPVDGAITAGV